MTEIDKIFNIEGSSVRIIRQLDPMVDCDSIEVLPFLDSIKILKVKGLRISPLADCMIDEKISATMGINEKFGLEMKVVEGKSAIIPFNERYFHAVMDSFSRYEILKQKYPDIQMQIFMDRRNPVQTRKYNNFNPSVFLDFLQRCNFNATAEGPEIENEHFFTGLVKPYLDSSINFINGISSRIFFEEAYFLISEKNEYGVANAIPNRNETWSLRKFLFEYRTHNIVPASLCNRVEGEKKCDRCNPQLFGGKLFADRILKYYDVNELEMPSKIFISRKKSNERYKEAYEKSIHNNSEKDFSRKEYEQRFIKWHDEIEKIFVSRGFISVDFENLSLRDQVAYMNNANYIVSFSGSGLVNMIFCKKNTNVLEISSNEFYVSYEQFSKKPFDLNWGKMNLEMFHDESVLDVFFK